MTTQNAKYQYRKLRRLVRQNGRYALRWMTEEERAYWDVLLAIQDSKDPLAERADIVAYCQRMNLPCTVRHTADAR